MNPFKEKFSMLPLREEKILFIFGLSLNAEIHAEMSS